MIIVRTPLRVSFLGGGTDHPSWFKIFGPGAVLSTSIRQYVYITLRRLPPIFDFKYRVAWRKIEQTQTLDEIEHPVIREVLRHYANQDNDQLGFEVVYHADLPSRSGLGSSSAFTVAALHAIHRQRGLEVSKHMLAREAIRVEQDLLQEPVGSQDQTIVAYGGLNRIDFAADGGLSVESIDMSPRRKRMFEDHLMLFFTGFTRDAGGVERTKIQNFSNRRAQLDRLYAMVGEGQAILENQNTPLADFGALLDEAWRQKKALSDVVSSGPIDTLYDAAMKAGALGGKLLGAGGGGFLLVYAAPENHPAIRAALTRIELARGVYACETPLRLDENGSEVVLYNPDLTANYHDLPVLRRVTA
jgi:D-glycero-alpha-D-manno-heptose-7-phosphate kinase